MGFTRARSIRTRLIVLPAVCCLLLAVCFPASASWTKQRTGSLAWFHAVHFLDRDRGWAVGSRGTLLATIDGGKTWQHKPQPTEDAIRDIYFTNERDGWLLCERNIYDLRSNDEQRAYLMKTTDGGDHWKRTNLRGANVDARLMRAMFNPAGHGWAFGEGGAIYRTDDAGASWLRLQVPTRYLLLGGTFIDDDSAWLVGAGGTILQTSDGGETWHHGNVAAASGVRFNSVSFVDARHGWAVGSAGTIYRTINGGRSWQLQSSGVSTDLLDVKFFDVSEGWAAGNEGTLLHTRDGGNHWTSERSVTPHALERLYFVDRSHGWAVGFGGTIIAYDETSNGTTPPRLR